MKIGHCWELKSPFILQRLKHINRVNQSSLYHMPSFNRTSLKCLPGSGHEVRGGVVDLAGDVEATEELQVPHSVSQLLLSQLRNFKAWHI